MDDPTRHAASPILNCCDYREREPTGPGRWILWPRWLSRDSHGCYFEEYCVRMSPPRTHVASRRLPSIRSFFFRVSRGKVFVHKAKSRANRRMVEKALGSHTNALTHCITSFDWVLFVRWNSSINLAAGCSDSRYPNTPRERLVSHFHRVLLYVLLYVLNSIQDL